jgi:hypothetical protein
MGYEGSLSDSPFPEVLRNIAQTAETGILTLQGEGEIIGVTFLDGAVVSVDAVNQAPEDGLGVVLLGSGLVSREEFSTLVAEHQAGGGRVIDLLVERGYINRQQLLDALRQQTLRLCAQACAWPKGQFRFYRGDQVSYEHGVEPVSVDDLLARMAANGAPEQPSVPAVEEPPPFVSGVSGSEAFDISDIEILRLDQMRTPQAEPLAPEIDSRPVALSDVTPAVAPPTDVELSPIEMPDVESWSEADAEDFEPMRPERRFWAEFQLHWASVTEPLLPGRLLGIGMLVSLAALVVLAPERFLVPLDGQQRIRTGLVSEVQGSLYSKVDQAAKTFFLLRGSFPETLSELVDLNLLAEGDMRLSNDRRLDYTDAPVSYLLAIEGEDRLRGAIQTEMIHGNFLLDPEFSPPELVDTPALVLLD